MNHRWKRKRQGTGATTTRARRPNPDFLSLEEIEHVVATAWRLVEEAASCNKSRAFANALKTEVAVYTGLRAGELHRLEVRDVGADGKVAVRMHPNLKRHKPRVAMFVNGAAASPTLAKLQAWILSRGLRSHDSLWTSDYSAWSWYIRTRLGPRAGLQRRVDCLNGARVPRYRLHAHATRAAFVMVCRRWPRRIGRPPLSWDTIQVLGGWDGADVVRRHYYWTDLDVVLDEVRTTMASP